MSFENINGTEIKPEKVNSYQLKSNSLASVNSKKVNYCNKKC